MKKLLLSLVMLMPFLVFAENTETYDFTSNGFGLPTKKENAVKEETSFTNKIGQEISVLNAYSIASNNVEAIMLMKDMESYILFPASTAPVKLVTIHSGVNCAAKAKVTVYANDTECGEVELNTKNQDFVVDVPVDEQAAGVVIKIVSDPANNTQIGSVTFTLDTDYQDLWLHGYKGWPASPENKLNTTDGVNYTLENVAFYVGNEFKIADEDYAVQFGGASNVMADTEYTLEDHSNYNVTVGEDMLCTVNFNLDTQVLKLVKTGEAPQPVVTYQIWASWLGDNWGGVDLTEEDGIWTAKHVNVTADGEFGIKILTDDFQTGWIAAKGEVEVDDTCNVTLATNDTKNIAIKAGKYNFAFNPEEMTLAIELVPAPAGDVYKEITTAEEVTLGDEYVFYYATGNKSLGLGPWSDNGKFFTAIAGVEVEDGEINTGNGVNADLLPLQIVAGTKEGYVALFDGEYYVKCTGNSNNSLGKSGELTAECNIALSVETSTVDEVEVSNFVLKFVEKAGSEKNLFQCNTNAGQERFSNYKSGSQKAPRLFKKDNTETAVSTIAVENTEKVVYNLQGVRVNAERLPAGLYIINGKKVLVK